MDNLIININNTIIQAGKAILKVYISEFNNTFKIDNSPLTEADLASNKIICDYLKKEYSYPIISEENKMIPFEERKKWEYYWLIDPLDGTKEFIKKTDDFTVNICLMKNNKPFLGFVYIPTEDALYFCDEKKAYKKEDASTETPIIKEIKVDIQEKKRVLTSRSHGNNALFHPFLEKIQKYSVEYRGSSLKICYIAEGKADLYPRFKPTCEWDTASAHAILKKAGGEIYDLNNQVLSYNKENLLNPHFIATNQLI